MRVEQTVVMESIQNANRNGVKEKKIINHTLFDFATRYV